MLVQKLLLFLLILLLPNNIFGAQEVTFSWIANNDCAEGYKIVMDTGTNVVQTIPGREVCETTYVIEDDTVSHSFSIFAYGKCGQDVMQNSKLGNMIPWCFVPPAPTIIRADVL